MAQLDEAIALLARLNVEVRSGPLGGAGGGLCRLKGRWVFLVDENADPATRYDRALSALADLPGADELFMSPALRDRFESARRSHPGQRGP